MNTKKKIIELSLLALVDKEDLKEQLINWKNLGIKIIHYDVMDGKFVKNETFTTQYLALLEELGFEVEVHLMVKDPSFYLTIFSQFKIVKGIVFHPSVYNKAQILDILLTYKNQLEIGLAFDIDENFLNYNDLLPFCSLCLIMGVKAGQGGQKICETGIAHLHSFNQWKKFNHLEISTIFDGGVNDQTISIIYNSSDIIVSGSYLANSVNKKEAYEKLLHDSFLN